MSMGLVKTLIDLLTGHCKIKNQMQKMGLAEGLCMEDEEYYANAQQWWESGRYSVLGKPKLEPEDLVHTSPQKIMDFIKRLDLEEEI